MNVTFFDFNQLSKINTTPEYYYWLRSTLKIKKVIGKNFIRIGNANDGGYIMVDNFQNDSGKRGIAYSFGISTDVSWDLDMAQRNYEIFMYDPTINSLPKQNERFHFFKEGIAGIEIKEKFLNTLEHFIKRNGHEDTNNMILKMDVEGAEWSFLEMVSSEILSKFDQLVFEFHFLTRAKTQNQMIATLSCIQKINQTHSLVHLHGNNFDSLLILDDKILIPDVLELTYARTSNYELVEDENIYLPIPLDNPNNKFRPEIPLGFWNRKFNNVLNITKNF